MTRDDLKRRLDDLEGEHGDDSESEGAMLCFVQTDDDGDVTDVNGVADPRTDDGMEFFDEARPPAAVDSVGGEVFGP